MAPLNVLTLNVQGLNIPQKRVKAFRYFQTKKAHILCLQETHFTPNTTPKFFHASYPQVYTASAQSKKRGTLIAFHRSTPFTIKSEIIDPEGRYLILTGHLLDNAITVVSYYAPNLNPLPFMSHLLQVVNAHKFGSIFICGDSNQVLLPFLDKTPFSPSHQNKWNLSSLLAKYNLADSWRETNPTKRGYTYYSNPHKSSSRIDHIFLSIGMLPEVLDSSIIPIPWSDHNAVLTVLSSMIPKKQDPTWYLPDIILKHPSYRTIIEQDLDEYITLNTSPDVSSLTLWEAHKPVLRGKIQRQMGILKRERKQLFHKLEKEHETAFMAFQHSHTPVTKARLDKARTELDLFLTDTADKMILRRKHSFYNKANKSGTLLARSLNSINKNYKPIHLKTTNGNFSSNPVKIVQKFSTHLKKLYTESNSFSEREADAFFTNLQLPRLNESHKNLLDAPITQEDVMCAIKELKLNKRPGPDGFTARYYRTFSNQLSPMMVVAFNDLLSQKSFRQESLTATICMIPKPHSDSTLCDNYRPISMLNTDVKLLGKILANRLNKTIGSLIHRDQVGFMPSRQAGDNIRRASLLACIAKKRKIPACFLSLDVRQAFDSVSWAYMEFALKKWGFGPNFISWVLQLYRNPKAYVKYAGYKSEMFDIQRGTRQGCPLSPLLFALLIEPLAQKIRLDPKVLGIELGGVKHKLCLYADDILLFLSSPQVSGPNLLPTLHQFASISGLAINPKKCLALNISLSHTELSAAKVGLPFEWPVKSIPYLGVHLTADVSNLYSCNYPALLKQLTNLMKSWTQLPLSWFGRVSAIKMTILPKLLYLFRVLPIPVPAHFLRIVQRRVSSFVWGPSKPRIKPQILHLPKTAGGLGFPNFAKYYQAAQLAILTKYHAKQEAPIWVSIEAIESDPISTSNLLWVTPKQRKHINNPITKHTLSLWDKVKNKHLLMSPLTPLLSFIKNPAFYPAWVSPKSFTEWVDRDCTQKYRFFDSTTIIPFPSLNKLYGIPPKEIFRYLQIKNFFQPTACTTIVNNRLSAFETICNNDPHARKVISTLYLLLLSNSSNNKIPYVHKWEEDLGEELSSEEWGQIWNNTKTMSINVLAAETNFKVLSRWYLVPSRVAKFSSNYSELCFRDCANRGTYFHTWWLCPIVQKFWSEIFKIINVLTNKTIPMDPKTALLNLKPVNVPHVHFTLTNQLLTAAKQTIAKAWKSPNLHLNEVINRMNVAMVYAKMSAIEADTITRFESVWKPWLDYVTQNTFNGEVLKPW